MRFASQFLSEAMRSEVLVSDLMSDCALVSVFASAGASVSSSKRSSGICRAYSRPRLEREHAFVDGKITVRITRADEFVRSAAKPVEDDSGGVGVWDE